MGAISIAVATFIRFGDIYSFRFGDGGSLRRRRRVVGVAKHTGVGEARELLRVDTTRSYLA